MKNWKSRIILLALVTLLSFAGVMLTYAVLKENTNPLINDFFAANFYSVTYDVNGKDDADSDVTGRIPKDWVFEASDITFHVFTIPSEPVLTREGYTFLGWSEDPADTSNLYLPNSTVTVEITDPEITLYAIWEAKVSFTLNYDLNYDGAPANAIAPQVYLANADTTSHIFEAISLPADLTRETHLFIGWADSATATVADYQPGESVTVDTEKSKTVYAVWEALDTFKVLFDANIPEDIEDADVDLPDSLIKVKGEGLESWTFQDVDITAEDLNANGTGLKFLGWALSETGDILYPFSEADPYVDIFVTESETTLYAIWDLEYFIRFDRGISDGSVIKVLKDTDETINNTYNDRIILSTTDPSSLTLRALYESSDYAYKRSGYMLVGFSAASGSQEILDSIPHEKAGLNNAQTVYAVWTKGTYALIYDANGGSNAPPAQVVQEAVTSITLHVTEDEPTAIEGSGAKFLGWSEDYDAVEPEYQANDPVDLDEKNHSKILYAIWDYTYALSYHPGLGSGNVPETVTIHSNKASHTIDIAEGPLPERGEDAYVFQYWAVTPDRQENEVRYYRGQYDDWAKNNITLEASNPSVTLYARYRPKTGYSVKFNANTTDSVTGMPYLPDRATTEIFLDVEIPSTVPTRTNYTCVGWADTADAKEVKYAPGTVIRLNADEGCIKELYAVWIPHNRFAVKVNYNGGQGYYQKDVSTGCDDPDWQKQYNTSYGEVSTLRPYSAESYTFSSIGGSSSTFYKPINGTLTLQGFSCACGKVSPSYTVINDTADHPSSGFIQMTNVPVDIDHSCVAESEYSSLNSKSYTLTLYANWYIKDKYQIRLNSGFNSYTTPVSIEKERTGGTPEHTWTAGSVKNSLSSRTGYVFLGYAYSPDATEPEILVDSSGYLNANLKVADGEPGVSSKTSDDGVVTYTLDLYAVWRTEQIFRIYVDYNGGAYSWTDTGDWWNILDDVTYRYPDDSVQTQQPADLPSYTFESAGHFYIPSWDNHTLLGYAYLKNSTTADLAATNYLTNITVDKEDKDNPAKDVTVNDDGYGMTTTTLNLYAVWEDKQEFIVKLDPNGGAYSSTSYTDDITHTESYSTRVASHTWTEGTAGSFSRPERYGYELLGYAYTADAMVPDFTMSTTSGSFKLNESVTVDEADHGVAGKTVVHSTSGAPDRTTLTLYAVWEKKQVYEIVFDWNEGYYSTSSNAYYKSQPFTQVKELNEDFYTLDPAANVYIPTRSGHKLLGYAYTRDATSPDFVTTTTAGSYHHFDNVTVTKGDTEHGVVTVPTEDGVDVTTLRLYAVWEKQQFLSVQLNMNDGTISSGTGQNASSTSTRTITTTQHAVTVDAYDYPTLSFKTNSSTVGSRSGYALKGFAYSKDATTPNFTVTSKYNGSYDYTITINETVQLNKKDESQTFNVKQDETTGVETHTLVLYAVWEEQQWFNVKLDFNGGYYYNTSGTQATTYTGAKYVTTPDKGEHTVSTGYHTQPSGEAGYHDDGYVLLGFAYTPDATAVVFPISTNTTSSTTSYYRSISNVKIIKAPNTPDGHTVVTTTDEATGIPTTTITLYAVWGLKMQYDVNGGAASTGPGTIQAVRTLDSDRTMDIWTGAPVYRSFKFGGWADTASGWPVYGVQGYYTPLSGVEVEGSQLKSTYSFDGSTGAKTVYATWYQEFNIHYSANGGTGKVPASELAYVDVRGVADVTQINHTHTVSAEIPKYDGDDSTITTKIFLGWSTEPDDTVPKFTSDPSDEYPGKATVYANADGQGAPKDLVLYAIWQDNPTLASKSTGSSSTGSDLQKNSNNIAPTEGSDGTTLPTEGSTTPTVQSWQYELRYDANGGDKDTLPDNETGACTESKVYVAVKFRNEDDDPLPERDGYTFLGWAEKADATEPQYLDGDSVEITAGENGADSVLTLYAVWQENSGADDTPPTTGGDDDNTPTTGSQEPTPTEGNTPPTEGSSDTTTPTEDSSDTTTPTTGSSDTTTPTTGGSDTTTPTTGSSDTTTPTTGSSDTTTPTTGGSDTTTPTTGGSDTTTPTTGGSDTKTPTTGGSDTKTPTTGGSDTTTPTTGSSDTTTPTTGGSDTTTPTTGSSDTTTPTTGSSDTTTPTTGSSDTKTPTTGSSDTTAPTKGGSDTKTPTKGDNDKPVPTGGGDDTPPAPTGGGGDTPPAPTGGGDNTPPALTGDGDDTGTGGDEA